jgi:hypothetical protein
MPETLPHPDVALCSADCPPPSIRDAIYPFNGWLIMSTCQLGIIQILTNIEKCIRNNTPGVDLQFNTAEFYVTNKEEFGIT